MDNTDIICEILTQKTLRRETQKQLQTFSEQDWEAFFDRSREQDVTAILYERMKTLEFSIEVPDTILERMRENYLTNAARNMLLSHHAREIITALTAAGIPVIGLKGLYLIENVYKKIALRGMSDLDILLKKEDIPLALPIIASLGYSPTTYFDIADKNIDIKHVPPYVKGEGAYLEVHWTLLEENEPFTIDAKGLWARAIPSKIAGVEALALSIEDLICHLCLHLAYQHNLNGGLRGLYDIAEVLRNFNDRVNWAMVEKIAREWGSERPTWLTLKLAEELLDGETSPDVMTRLQPENFDPWVLEEARRQILKSGGHDGVPMTPDLAALAAEKGLLKRIKLLSGRIFLPRHKLARLYGVPPNSIRIYGCYFRRFIELSRSYGGVVRNVFKQNAGALQSAEKELEVVQLRTWMGN